MGPGEFSAGGNRDGLAPHPGSVQTLLAALSRLARGVMLP